MPPSAQAPEPALPEFIPPMLAGVAEPFDADTHLFEVKWDGMRTLAYRDRGGVRLVNRHHHDVTGHFPELTDLQALPVGVVLDGELVVTIDGRPDFQRVMGRRHARSAATVRRLAAEQPATFVAFDLLYAEFCCVQDEPLEGRRDRLAAALKDRVTPHLALSEGIVGQGRMLFEHACAQQLEGVVAKKLGSPYLPGRRSEAWLKIKRQQTALCAILGFLPDGERDFKSLAVAIEDGGALRYVGQVGSGFDAKQRDALNAALRARVVDAPLVPCPITATWVESGLYCRVTYLEMTSHGHLRAPVFAGMID